MRSHMEISELLVSMKATCTIERVLLFYAQMRLSERDKGKKAR